MEKEKLVVKMLGDFSVAYNGRNISPGRNLAAKTMQLFQMLMLNPRQCISKEKIMLDFYKYGDFSNKNNSLNNIIYRLRKILADAGVPGDSYISIKSGMCVWDCPVSLEVDALEFSGLMETCKNVTHEEGENRIELLCKAWLLYRGDLLPTNSMEEWVILESARYKKLYRSCTNQIAEYLWKTGRFDSLLTLYTKAVSIEPYEEWQLGQLDVLMSMGNYKRAFEVYENMEHLNESMLERPMSEGMEMRFRNISEYLKGKQEDIQEVRTRILDLPIEARETPGEREGAYECSYPLFLEMYRLMRRTAERSKTASCLMQCIIVNRQKLPMQNKPVRKKSVYLAEAIKESLRCGDIFTQYMEGKFLIILNRAEKEHCKRIFKRIAGRYEILGGSRRDLEWQVTLITKF